jgi:hypothetical protein
VKRVSTLLAAMLLLIATMAAPAAAHGKDVHPPGAGDGHEFMAVSKAWAQAHCQAAAPEQATANSGGVVRFSPAEALPCPATPNPGGQEHPHTQG